MDGRTDADARRVGQRGRQIEERRQRAADDAIDEDGLGTAECRRRCVEVRRAIIMEGGGRKHFLQPAATPSKKAEILRTKEHATDRPRIGQGRGDRGSFLHNVSGYWRAGPVLPTPA